MAPKRWIDKKNAQSYTLLHRSHEDPLYNDSDAAERVFVKVDDLNSATNKTERKNKYTGGSGSTVGKGKNISELETEASELFKDRRENEGEAALYGIAYDDSKYDYMQHLKPIGGDPSAVFIAKKDLDKKKSAQRRNNGGELMFKSEHAAENEKIQLPEEALPSKDTIKKSYQDQQDIPDSLTGLQPDMDPNLREVLEALEDEEFVEGNDEEEEGFFSELLQGGEKKENEEEDDEWADFDPADYSDFDQDSDRETVNKEDVEEVHVEPKEGEEEWETAFRKFKLEQEKNSKNDDSDDGDNLNSEIGDVVGPMSTASGITTNSTRKKRRGKKGGARTEMTGLSMSSSVISRNAGLTLLDDRFDKIEEEYEDEEEQEPGSFDMNKERPDLESALDDFLDNYVVDGKKLYKKK